MMMRHGYVVKVVARDDKNSKRPFWVKSPAYDFQSFSLWMRDIWHEYRFQVIAYRPYYGY